VHGHHPQLLPLQHAATHFAATASHLLPLEHTCCNCSKATLQHAQVCVELWSNGMIYSYCDCNALTTMATRCNTAKTQVLEQLWMGMMHNVDGLASAAMREGTHLQYTATHCNTLQHNATHCNTLIHNVDELDSTAMCEGTHLQHTATHCNTLQHTATHCNTLQYSARH